MDYESQFKVQAWLDGELPAGEARHVEELVARDAAARDLAAELRATSTALAGSEPDVKLPESREFYWSKIEREIRRQEPSEPSPAPALSALFAAWRRFLVPASAIAVLVIAGLLAGTQSGFFGHSMNPELEASVADPGAFTYRDFDTRTTLVWLSYPAEKELANNDVDDTLPWQ
jgi:anti-sigma-K factor RskA